MTGIGSSTPVTTLEASSARTPGSKPAPESFHWGATERARLISYVSVAGATSGIVGGVLGGLSGAKEAKTAASWVRPSRLIREGATLGSFSAALTASVFAAVAAHAVNVHQAR